MTIPSMKKEECPVKELEIIVGRTDIGAVAFAGDGKHLLSGTSDVRVWQAQDGKETAVMEAKVTINCLAISKDSKWIAAGTLPSILMVWDAETRQRVFERRESGTVHCVDFSADSARLVASGGCTATVWDIPTGVNRIDFDHGSDRVKAAKYSPRGDRIATATENFVRVWDSNDGYLLVHVPVRVTPWRNAGLLWSNDHLFVVSGDRIKRLEASTGSLITEWPVPASNFLSSIALPKHGEFIAYSTDHSVSFWSTSTPHSRLAQMPEQRRGIRSVALSPDDLFLALGGEQGKLAIKSLYGIHSNLHYSFQEPDMNIDDHTCDLWKHCPMKDVEELFTKAVSVSSQNYHALACRALVRARLKKYDDAIDDAQKSVEIRPSGLGYIAKSVALAGKGETDDADRVCDIAIDHFPRHVSFLLLFKAIIMFIAGKHSVALLRVNDLIGKVPLHSICYVVQAYMHLLSGELCIENRNYEDAIQSFERARAQLNNYVGGPLTVISLITGWKFDDLNIKIEQRLCEALYAADRIQEAAKSLLRMIDKFVVTRVSICRIACEHPKITNCIIGASERLQEKRREVANQTGIDGEWTTWLQDFNQRCAEKLMCSGGAAADAGQLDDAIAFYTLALSLHSVVPPGILVKRGTIFTIKGLWQEAFCDANQVMLLDPSSSRGVEKILKEWARAKLSNGSWTNVLVPGCSFDVPSFTIYRMLCECLQMNDCVSDAAVPRSEIPNNGMQLASDFRGRRCGRLNQLGDDAVVAQNSDETIFNYSTALSLDLDPTFHKELLDKRCKAHIAKKSWRDALNDADEIIRLDPSCPQGHERRYMALRGAGDHTEMLNAFNTLLLTMSQSPDPVIRSRGDQCTKMKKTIQGAIKSATERSPHVLINTTSGRLCDKSQQKDTFTSTPLFTELVLSAATDIGAARIKQEVAKFYQYAMFSHTWEANEPTFATFDQVVPITVYQLNESPTHHKLQMFCKIAREAGYNWAWSDTCCIDKEKHSVLQEAIVAMFRWYEGSALTIVFLRGVRSPARRGDLVESIWNSRAWTFQEYRASRVVRFYTEDWKLYMDLDIPNHKDAPEIISEMEEATGISSQTLMALQPGLDDIRIKLCLASRRNAEFLEDVAYSLLGIFSTPLTITYGELDKALGRLLAKLVTSSTDTSILAWTGESGTFHTCLPAHISVFWYSPATHIPKIVNAEMDAKLTALQSTLLDPTLVMELFDQLMDLPTVQFKEQRMELPCLMFKLQSLRASRNRLENGFCGYSDVLGIVKIRTRQNLSKFDSLYVVHPWIDFLVPGDHGEEIVSKEPENIDDPLPSIGGPLSSLTSRSNTAPTSQPSQRASILNRAASLGWSIGQWAAGSLPMSDSPPPSPEASQDDKYMKALKVIARLKEPFGALLLAPPSSCKAYKRVAADCLIRVQLTEITSAVLNTLIESVRTVDVL